MTSGATGSRFSTRSRNSPKLKTLYNPGLAAVVLGHIPLGIWYLLEVETSARDWAFALLYVALIVVGFALRSTANSLMPHRCAKRVACRVCVPTSPSAKRQERERRERRVSNVHRLTR